MHVHCCLFICGFRCKYRATPHKENEMAQDSHFSQYLKQGRIQAGLSQKDVSEKLGYTSSQFISNWERGLSNPPPKAVKKLAALYHVSLEELLDLLLQDTLQQVTLDFKKKIKGIL